MNKIERLLRLAQSYNADEDIKKHQGFYGMNLANAIFSASGEFGKPLYSEEATPIANNFLPTGKTGDSDKDEEDMPKPYDPTSRTREPRISKPEQYYDFVDEMVKLGIKN